jgi:hypothetical protein
VHPLASAVDCDLPATPEHVRLHCFQSRASSRVPLLKPGTGPVRYECVQHTVCVCNSLHAALLRGFVSDADCMLCVSSVMLATGSACETNSPCGSTQLIMHGVEAGVAIDNVWVSTACFPSCSMSYQCSAGKHSATQLPQLPLMLTITRLTSCCATRPTGQRCHTLSRLKGQASNTSRCGNVCGWGRVAYACCWHMTTSPGSFMLCRNQ